MFTHPQTINNAVLITAAVLISPFLPRINGIAKIIRIAAIISPKYSPKLSIAVSNDANHAVIFKMTKLSQRIMNIAAPEKMFIFIKKYPASDRITDKLPSGTSTILHKIPERLA